MGRRTNRRGAHWKYLPWRYQIDGDFGWTYAETLRDIKIDVEDEDREVIIQKRTGRAGRTGDDYVYIDHSIINPTQED